MDKGITGFFTNFNAVSHIEKEDYSHMEAVIAVAETTVRTTGYGVYIFDYYQKNVVYVSSNIKAWSGIEAADFLENGLNAYLKHFNPDDLEMLYDINDAAFKFWSERPAKECLNYVVSYDFRFKNYMFNQRYSPMIVKNDRIWLAMCVVSMSSNDEPGNIVMKNTSNGTAYRYSMGKKSWVQQPKILLSEKEKSLIRYSAQGLSSGDIAELFHLGTETVRTHKKNLFKKLGVNSMAEAIIYANNTHLL